MSRGDLDKKPGEVSAMFDEVAGRIVWLNNDVYRNVHRRLVSNDVILH